MQQRYIEYIIEARKRGFRDDVIKQSLIDKNWPESEINKAFAKVDGETILTKEIDGENENAIKKEIEEHHKLNKEIRKLALNAERKLNKSDSVMIFLDKNLREALEKRAKKNMLTLPEQIEDILRRSTLNQKLKRTPPEEKLDDRLVGLFSRKNTGPKAKSKKKTKGKTKKGKKITKKIKKKPEKKKTKKKGKKK
ncbi:MAG: hypothetical protein BWY36_00657 [Candidatus Diapherotrites archaeon ADurb.Bin253]|jgi:hypothetical protein|nr:hypothetical protein [Candidatus Pacearchaeota archaeon]OQA67554.1 MAG: hypothetical protein BWY36_00657 [Candidatus Diapherotrites archaeon ADurb.Bin253]HNZ52335.1 hypothetical protein [Candidatus Pacearchaeota archaeon]HOF44508.1 hypothetical protein [Candidatus Pacearchaeota archaeon]HOH04411.1 hypothetical protein [Candidatus Pacearchaeota archaeon]